MGWRDTPISFLAANRQCLFFALPGTGSLFKCDVSGVRSMVLSPYSGFRDYTEKMDPQKSPTV